jgi:hypothetical protein
MTLKFRWVVMNWASTERGNAKLSLCLTKHYAMKIYGGMDIHIHVFLTYMDNPMQWVQRVPYCE